MTSRAAVVLAALVVSCGGARGRVDVAQAKAAVPTLPCVDAWGESRFRESSWDHVVHLASRCERDAVCMVATDVSPAEIEALVPAGAHVEVLTAKRSPTRDFAPKVACRPGG